MLVRLYRGHRTEVSSVLLGIQKRLDFLLEREIVANLTESYYSSVTASLIYSFGLCEPDEAIIPIHKILLENLKKYYLPMFKLYEKIALSLLPPDTKIDPEAKKLVRKDPTKWHRDKTSDELSLDD